MNDTTEPAEAAAENPAQSIADAQSVAQPMIVQQPIYMAPPVAIVQAPPTNGLAIAGLILSIIPFLEWLGLILSIIAFRQIRRTGAGGRGLAIAGMIIGGIFSIPLAVMLIFSINFLFAGMFSGMFSGIH